MDAKANEMMKEKSKRDARDEEQYQLMIESKKLDLESKRLDVEKKRSDAQ